MIGCTRIGLLVPYKQTRISDEEVFPSAVNFGITGHMPLYINTANEFYSSETK